MLRQWKRRSVRMRFMTVATVLVTVFASLWCWAGWRGDRATERHRAGARLEAVVRSAAVALDGDAHSQVAARSAPASWADAPSSARDNHELLARLLDENQLDGSISIIQLTERFQRRLDTNPDIVHDGLFEVTVSSDETPQWGERVAYLPALQEVLVDGNTVVVGPVQTKAGTQLLAFAPLNDAFGEPVGLIRAASSQQVALWPMLFKLAARLGLAASLIYFTLTGTRKFVDRTLAPLDELARSARAMAAGKLGSIIAGEQHAQEVRGMATALEDLRTGMIERSARNHRSSDRLAASKRASEETLARHSSLLVRMSHGVRPPLEAFSAALRRLDGLALESEQRGVVRHTLNAGYELTHSLEEILQVARIEGGDRAPVQAPFQLGPMLRQIVHLGRTETEEHGTAFRVVAPEDLPNALVGDPGALQYILTELVDNAAHATVDGTVSLRITPVDADEETIALKFEVADTGRGMQPDEAARVTQWMMANVDDEGTPHGLTVAAALTRLSGSELAFDSRPGSGTRFWFCLRFPKAAAALRPVAPAPVATAVPAPVTAA